MKTLFRLCLLLLTLCAVFSTAVSAVSPALEVIRSETRLIKSCVNGERVSFNADEFVSLTGAEFEYITLTSVPAVSEGVLKLAGVDVLSGQHISLSGLAHLKFLPNKNAEKDSGFTFTVAADGWENKELDCIIRFTETENLAPLAASLNLSTYQNVCLSTPLGAYDPDGDGIRYAITQYPQNGTLKITEGVAVYTPSCDFVGTDSFVFYTEDSFGKKSELATAKIKVNKNSGGLYFADMQGSSTHLSAIRAAEQSIMTYTLIDDSYYFYPSEQVSRIDYAVMLITALGTSLPDKPYATEIFTDTAAQSRVKKLYLEAAVLEGYITADADLFRPDEPISVAEALTITEKAAGKSLASLGKPFIENTNRPLSKEEAAVLLTSLIKAD